MKIFISKVLIFLLALLLVIPLASCSNENEKQPEVTNNNEVEEDETDELDLPHETYGGRLVTVYTWKPYGYEFVLTEEDAYANIVTQALWERDMFVEEKLDVDIEYHVYSDDPEAGKNEQFVNDLQASAMVGDGAYDYVLQQNAWAGIATLRGLYLNLNENEEMDLSRSYWDYRLVEATQLNDKVYFASGDIGTTCTTNVHCLNYNKSVLEDRGLEDPYDLIQNNQWTWAKVFEMSKDLYIDTGDDPTGIDDTYGFVAGGLGALDSIYFSAGLSMIERDEDGFFAVSPDYRSERTSTFLKQIKDFFDGDDALYYNGDARPVYMAGLSLFNIEVVGTMSQYVQAELPFKMGAAPLPKYNEEQDGYYANLTNNYSLVSIPFDCTDPEVSGAVLEYLAKYGEREVIPALFEQTYKLQYSETLRDAELFDLIRDSRTYDMGLLYGVSTFQFKFARCVYGSMEWVSTAVSTISEAENTLIPELEKLAELKR